MDINLIRLYPIKTIHKTKWSRGGYRCSPKGSESSAFASAGDFFWYRLRATDVQRNGTRKGGKTRQKGDKRKPKGIKIEPNGSQRLPKWGRKRAKGSQRASRGGKGAKIEPKGSRDGAQRDTDGAERVPKFRYFAWKFDVQNNVNKYAEKTQKKQETTMPKRHRIPTESRESSRRLLFRKQRLYVDCLQKNTRRLMRSHQQIHEPSTGIESKIDARKRHANSVDNYVKMMVKCMPK